MRDDLPVKPWVNENAVVNLDSSSGPGTHWVCYKKRGNSVQYFDSFGNLRPPVELLRYLSGNKIFYNYTRHQSFESSACGHICLEFLVQPL